MNNQHLGKGELFTLGGAELTPGVSASLLPSFLPPPTTSPLELEPFPGEGKNLPPTLQKVSGEAHTLLGRLRADSMKIQPLQSKGINFSIAMRNVFTPLQKP